MKSKKRYAVLVALLCAALTAGGILPAYASGKTGTAAITEQAVNLLPEEKRKLLVQL